MDLAALHDISFHSSIISFFSVTGPLTISSAGYLVIPQHCSPFLLFEFVKKNAEKIRIIQKQNQT